MENISTAKKAGKKIPRAKSTTSKNRKPAAYRPPVVLATLEHDDIFGPCQKQREKYVITPEERSEQLRIMQEAANAFGVFYSLWSGLTDLTPGVYAGSSQDSIPLLRLEKLATATHEAVYVVAKRLSQQYAFERADLIENPDRRPPVPANYFPDNRSVDFVGTAIKIGDRVATDDWGRDVGTVYAVFGESVCYLTECGENSGEWGWVPAHECRIVPTMRDPRQRQRALQAQRPDAEFLARREAGRKIMRDESAKQARVPAGYTPKHCVDEFIDDSNDLLARYRAFNAAVTPLRGEAGIERVRELEQRLADLIEQVVGQAATYLDQRNPNASAGWQEKAHHLLRPRERQYLTPTVADNADQVITARLTTLRPENAKDVDGRLIKVGDSVNYVQDEGAGVVVAVAGGAVIVADAQDSEDIFCPRSASTCRIIPDRRLLLAEMLSDKKGEAAP